MDSPSRLRSSRTRCTCCRPDHAGAADPDRMRNHVRSWTSRTIRSAFRRRDVHEADSGRMRNRARSSSNRNVCILSPCQFSFRPILYQTASPRTIPPPISIRNRKSATLEIGNTSTLATFSPPPAPRGMPTAPSGTCRCAGRPARARRSRWRWSPYRTACR